MVDSAELGIDLWWSLILKLEWNRSGSEKLINLGFNLIFGGASVSEISDIVLFSHWLLSNWRLFKRSFLWHDILWRSSLGQLLVVIGMYSIFLVFSDLVYDWLDLMEFESLILKFLTVPGMLVIEEFLIINFHFFKLLVVNSISFNKLMHLFFVLLLFSLDVVDDVRDLRVDVVTFLHDSVGVVSGVINSLDPLLFLSVKFILVFSFYIYNSVCFRLNVVTFSL